MTLSFLLTSLIVVASPGTGVLYTLAAALTRGSRASIAAAFGCTLGIVPHMTAAMLGLAAVLHTSALAFAALKWCGVAYLLYMSWQALRETGALAVDGEIRERSVGRSGDRDRLPDQHPQSKTVGLLPGFPAAVHRRGRSPCAGANAGIERRLHGDDVCGVRGLRPLCGIGARARHLPPACHGLAAPEFCRRLRRARRQAGVRGAIASPADKSGGQQKSGPCARHLQTH